MTKYFSSDWHIGHPTITEWERTNFKNTEEHDAYIYSTIQQQAKKMKDNDIFYFLGDFGDINKVTYFMKPIINSGAKTVFIAGNHDLLENKYIFEIVFDEVYWHPIYLSERIIVSHFPQAIWPGQINIHGHIHNGYMDNKAYTNCNIHYTNYRFVMDKNLNVAFGVTGPFNTRFLSEPWIENQKATIERENVILKPDMHIDVSATKAYWKMIAKNSLRE